MCTAAAGLLGQHGVPGHHQLLGDGGPAGQPQLPGDPALVHRVVLHHVRVLAVGEDGQLLPVGQDQAVPHQVGVLHRHPVVGQGHRPGLLQGLEVGELLPRLPHRHRPDGPDVDAAGLGRLLLDVVHPLRAVGGGPGIGHTGDGGKAPVGRRRRPGRDGLLVLKARLPQVHVHIHQPGAHHQAAGVNHLGVRLADVAADHRHPAVLQQDVHNAADAAHRVHQPPLPNQQLHEITPFFTKKRFPAPHGAHKKRRTQARSRLPSSIISFFWYYTLKAMETQYLAAVFSALPAILFPDADLEGGESQ